MRSAVLLLLVVTTSAAADSTVPMKSVWIGAYTCGQGVTNVRLTIETRDGGDGHAAAAHFQFGPNETNRSVPHGDYWLTGTVREVKGRLEVTLRPDHWGVRPSGYVMVGVTATSDREQRSLDGTIDDASCTTIHVKRVTAEAEDRR